jgi:hypothetical protein
MTINSSASVEQLAAERFARFQQRPEVRRVTSRYADWARTSDGVTVNVQLSGLAMMRLAGRLSRNDYKKAVRDLAATSSIPPHDFRIFAKCILEFTRCALAGSGQFDAGHTDWDVEGDDE